MNYPNPANSPYGDPGDQQNQYPGGYAPPPGMDPGYGTGGQYAQGGWPPAPSGPQQPYPQQAYQQHYQQPYGQYYPSGPQQPYPQQAYGQYQQPYPQQPYGQYQQPYGQRQNSGDERQMALFSHLGGALLGLLVPLILYLVKKDESPYVRHQAAQAFNFQCLLIAGYMVSVPLIVLLMFVGIGFIIGYLIFPLLWIGGIVFGVMGTQASQRGEWYTYPMSIPILK